MLPALPFVIIAAISVSRLAIGPGSEAEAISRGTRRFGKHSLHARASSGDREFIRWPSAERQPQ
jgi:hypothetical protein